MQQTTKDRIQEIKDFYRFDVLKEVATDKVKSVVSMCTDTEGNIYVACRLTKTIMVFDNDLQEKTSFKVDIVPLNIVIAGPFLVVANWHQEYIALYRTSGEKIWVRRAQEVNSIAVPGIGCFNDGTAWLVDYWHNTIYDFVLRDTGEFVSEEKCMVQGCKFYDPNTDQWMLRGLFKHNSVLCTFYNNVLYSINPKGELTEHMRWPRAFSNLVGVISIEQTLYYLDAGDNIIEVYTTEDKHITRFKTICFNKNEGVLLRGCNIGSHIIFSKKKTNGDITLIKALL